jgi:RNA polymerase sigma-70 factor (ECF subfamily)
VAVEAELKPLMLAGLTGDAGAHRALLKQLSGYLRGYFGRQLGRFGRGTTDAEDLVQEVLLAIHTRRHTYDPAELLTPWVHAIARYKLIDYLRRARAPSTDVPIDDATDLVAARENHDGAESTHDLARLLGQLPERPRRIIECVKLEGLSVAETASRHGLSESNVKVIVHRGLTALAAAVAREREA